jgi:hypothetical protein
LNLSMGFFPDRNDDRFENEGLTLRS